jgi:hypothetical protein
MSNPDDEQEPPQPPEIDRRLRLAWPQLVGFPIIAIIPLLALGGVFGERWATSENTSGPLAVSVEYPSRFRARLSKPLVVRIENRSDAPLDSVEVAFDSSYVENFANAGFIPEARQAYVVVLDAVRAGETRRVQLQLEGESMGAHDGRVVVRARNDSAAVAFRTTVFP